MGALRFTEEEFAKLNLSPDQIQHLDGEGNTAAPPSPPPANPVRVNPGEGANRQTFRPPSLAPPIPPRPTAQDTASSRHQRLMQAPVSSTDMENYTPSARKKELTPMARLWVQVLMYFIVSCVSVMFIATPGILLLALVVLTVVMVCQSVKVRPRY